MALGGAWAVPMESTVPRRITEKIDLRIICMACEAIRRAKRRKGRM